MGCFLLGSVPGFSRNSVSIIGDPTQGVALVFFNQVTPSTRNGTKFMSRVSIYTRFCFQLSIELMILLLPRLHCLGTLIMAYTTCGNTVQKHKNENVLQSMYFRLSNSSSQNSLKFQGLRQRKTTPVAKVTEHNLCWNTHIY